MISITNHARDVVPSYRPDQVEAMLRGDFSGDIEPTFIDGKTGQPIEAGELRRRLARATAPVFATSGAKVAAALAVHRAAQAAMSRRGFSQVDINVAFAKLNAPRRK